MVVINAKKMQFARVAMREVLKRNPWRFALMITLGFFSGIFGGIGIGAVIPLFSLISEKSPVQVNSVTRLVEGMFRFVHIPFTTLHLVVFIACLFVAKAIVQFTAKYVNIRTTAEYEERIRRDLFVRTFHADWTHLMNQKSGYLERIMVNDAGVGASIILRVNDFILMCISLVIYLSVAMSISGTITIITLVIGGLLFLVLSSFMARTRALAKKTASTEKETTHHIAQTLSGAKLIKAFGMEEHVIRQGRGYFATLRDVKVKTGFYQYLFGQIYEPIGFIFVVFLFVFYQRMPGFDIVSFAAVMYLIEKMFLYIQSVQGLVYNINDIGPYLQSFVSYRTAAEERKEIDAGSEPFSLNRDLRFNNVSFSYIQERSVLSGVSLMVKKGEMLGLIGSSGAGKTTIVDLLLRLFRPASGEILVDDRPISAIGLQDWRKNIRYVSQDIFLLNDTVENNIRFFDEGLSKDDIVRAAKIANIYDFIAGLPDGFNTIIGERGVLLSGGERQRIALARALAGNPKILILDEATSSLDNKSEALVQRAIEGLRGGITIVAIAHRLSTIMNADRLLVLDGGKIVEEGTPRKLLENKDSHFYQMYNIRKDD